MLESKYQEYKDQGLVMITLIGENAQSGEPDLSTLTGWAGLGASYTLMADVGKTVINRTWPTAEYWGMDALLKPGIEIILYNPVNKDMIKPQ